MFYKCKTNKTYVIFLFTGPKWNKMTILCTAHFLEFVNDEFWSNIHAVADMSVFTEI